MAGFTFSPDTLAANPDLAAKLKTSKAKTPGGKGHGHTPDENAYRRAGMATMYDPNRMLRKAATVALCLIRFHAKRAGRLGEATVRQAIDALGELGEGR